MKNSLHSFMLALLVFALPLGAVALTNKDVIKMQKAGLSEDTIIAAIQKEHGDFDTSTDALIDLKAAGVSEKVIQKMIGPQPGSASGGSSDAPADSVFLQDFPSIEPPKIEPAVGKEYFTRFSFHQEGNEYSTTNYARGELVPINTPVKLVSMSGNQLVLKRLDTNQEVKVKNEEKYTNKPIAGIAALMLSVDKTALEKLPEKVAAAVKNGEMHKGMTKELVLMTRGYPPAHETPSVENDRWVYWSSRFVKLTIVFTNGRLTEGRGIL